MSRHFQRLEFLILVLAVAGILTLAANKARASIEVNSNTTCGSAFGNPGFMYEP